MNKVYVATVVDCGESCDGKARVLGVFHKLEDAKAMVQNDMESYCDNLTGADLVADFDEMAITNEDEDAVCLWNICESEISSGDSEMKPEYCALRDDKVWFRCSSEAEAVSVSEHYNADFCDGPKYAPCMRLVTEWKHISQK